MEATELVRSQANANPLDLYTSELEDTSSRLYLFNVIHIEPTRLITRRHPTRSRVHAHLLEVGGGKVRED